MSLCQSSNRWVALLALILWRKAWITIHRMPTAASPRKIPEMGWVTKMVREPPDMSMLWRKEFSSMGSSMKAMSMGARGKPLRRSR